jgi:secreted trypsin-like serine protease
MAEPFGWSCRPLGHIWPNIYAMAGAGKIATRRRDLIVGLLIIAITIFSSTLAGHARAGTTRDLVHGASPNHHGVASKHPNPTATASVVGGESAVAGSFPFMAFVASERSGGLEGDCSGTVVSSNLILTAAHCVTTDEGTVVLPPSAFTVVTGTIDWATAPREISAVSAVLPDPAYQAIGPLGGWHDDALLELATPILAPPVRLTSTSFWTPGTEATIAGWGETEDPQTAPTTNLQWGSTVVQSEGFCKERAGSNFHPLTQLCTIDAPTYKSATCHGDSGGPLLAIQPGTSELVEIGVTNFGIAEGCPSTSPRFDTRSDVISNWVANRIRELAARPPTVTTPVTSPAPPRTTRDPAPPALPMMTSSEARSYARLGLIVGLKADFVRHRDFHVTCRRIASTEQRCIANWSVEHEVYSGSVVSFYTFLGSTVVWNDLYDIRSVDFSCQTRGKNCPVRRVHSGRVLDSGT